MLLTEKYFKICFLINFSNSFMTMSFIPNLFLQKTHNYKNKKEKNIFLIPKTCTKITMFSLTEGFIFLL